MTTATSIEVPAHLRERIRIVHIFARTVAQDLGRLRAMHEALYDEYAGRWLAFETDDVYEQAGDESGYAALAATLCAIEESVDFFRPTGGNDSE